MTAKEYLLQISQCDRKIKALVQTRDLLRQKALCNSSPCMNADKVSGSGGVSAPMADAVDRYVDIERELDAMQDRYGALILKIMKQINDVGDDRYAEVLRLRYIENKRLEDISCIMRKRNGDYYSYAHIRRLHGWALVSFYKKYRNDVEMLHKDGI